MLDASAAVELVLNTEVGSRVRKRIADPEVDLHAPHLVDPEVTHVLRRFVHQGWLDAARARLALDHWLALDVERHGQELLLPRVWDLRDNLSAYDATYVALAEMLELPLLTCDRRLARAVPWVEIVTFDSAGPAESR